MESHEDLADQLDKRADDLERQQEQLGDRIGEVRDDWHQKQQSESVPGAEEPDHDQADSEPPPEEMEQEGPA